MRAISCCFLFAAMTTDGRFSDEFDELGGDGRYDGKDSGHARGKDGGDDCSMRREGVRTEVRKCHGTGL